MDGIGQVTLSTITIFGQSIQYNPAVITMTWVCMVILFCIFFFSTRNLQKVPNKKQNFIEMIFEFLKEITYSTLGPKDGKLFLPLIVTLFTFILLANWIGVLPNFIKLFGFLIAILHNIIGTDAVTFISNGLMKSTLQVDPSVWYGFLINFPDFEEPTRSINTDLALGMVIFVIVHWYGIRNKGILNYLGDYMDPVPAKLPYTLFFFLNPFFYLNVIGTISNVVSHSFRLFGNMFGGFMIITIVSSLLKYFVAPVGLYAFFGLFSGLVQAFVFTMLAVTYIAQQK